MAMEAEAATTTELALSETDINWDRLDKTRFHLIGAILFTAQSALLHPTAVVKTRMQVADATFAHMNDMVLKSTEGLDMTEATRIAMANGVAGMLSNIVSCVYYVPLDVVCQRMMVQGLPGITTYNGPFDVVCKLLRSEGLRGLYKGFGITILTQSPASALWWGAYGAAQYVIWRSLGYANDAEKKPSHLEIVTVQATAGTIAGACSSVITTPVDTIKTRLQVMDNCSEGRPSVIKTTKILLEEDGWRGFYRGFGPRFLNMSLWGMSMIVTYELISELILQVVLYGDPL